MSSSENKGEKKVERVFPIRLSILENSPFLRNVANRSGTSSYALVPCQTVQEQPEPEPEPEKTVETPGTTIVYGNDATESIVQVQVVPKEVAMVDGNGKVAEPETEPDPRVSVRYEYAILEDGSHGVVQGTQKVFTRCQDEPIHIPGAIQSYGMLIALRRRAEGIYIPRIVSENSYQICRYTPSQLFAFDSFSAVMPLYQSSLFAHHLRGVRQTYDLQIRAEEPVVFPFSFFDPDGRILRTWCAAHYVGGDTDLYICEFELQDYSMHPLAVPQEEEDEDVYARPVDTLGSDHMDVATVSSMVSKSQPVVVNAEALSGGTDPATSVEIVGVVHKIAQQFAEATTVEALLDAIVGVTKELTKFSRVMVYEFDKDYNGTVVAELMDPTVTRDVYRGLHFPHTDVPPQARRLYMINKVRVLFDREHGTSRLVGRETADVAVPLDLTHSYLRAMSPVHLRYLANMEVRSSMSMSLQYEGQLWGLICCHSYGATATQVPFSVRELCYFVGLTASTCLEKLLNSDKLQVRRIMDTLNQKENPNECITASSEELLNLFEADCGFLVIEGEAKTIGRLGSYTEALILLRYLFFRRSNKILFSNNIGDDFGDLHYQPGFKSIAGVLYIPLSTTTDDCVVFFRKSRLRQVNWAGQPVILPGNYGMLEPRNSFQKWTEIVHGSSKAWTPEQENIATMAQLVYGSFIRVWREKEIAVKETRLKRLLLHDASHQVRTPLNQVINLLEMALEKPLEEGTKQELSQSHAASKSLIYVIDDLLNLTGSTTGSIAMLASPFDISICIEEALDSQRNTAREKGVEIISRTSAGASRSQLRGDPQSLSRVIATLVTNAIQHTTGGRILVEWGEAHRHSNHATMRISVTDYGPGFTERELDDMFQEFEQVSDEDAYDHESKVVRQRRNALRVGVGLAFAARYVKQRGGQLKVVTSRGAGSTFSVEVPFMINSRPTSLATRRDASPLPALPFPARPDSGLGPGRVAFPTPGTTGVAMSPPLVTGTTPSTGISPMDAGTPASRFTIIVADDNIINVQILKRRLTKMGHQVFVGRDGQEAYNMFVAHQSTIDFILMDVNMPVVDGWASTRMIREQEHRNPMPSHACQSFGRTPIFAVSGMLRRGDEQMYIDGGFNGWMPKPINMKWLGKCLGGAWDARARSLGGYDEERFELGGWFPEPELPVPPREEPPPGEQAPTPVNAAIPVAEIPQVATGAHATTVLAVTTDLAVATVPPVAPEPTNDQTKTDSAKVELNPESESEAPPVPDLIPQSPEEVYPPLPETPAIQPLGGSLEGPSSPTGQPQLGGYFCQASRPSKRNATPDVSWTLGPRGTPFEVAHVASLDQSLKILGDQEDPPRGEHGSSSTQEYPSVYSPWRAE